ncbi:MAG TPA: hypothetical protein DD671_09750 [Balneolaceae bacterium]|nr:hypothetical protein [Balneolaceae bacterium]
MAKITGVEARVLVNHFRCVMEKKGYVFFEGKKPYDLNIVGVRSYNMRANKFDDNINVFYKNTKKDWEVRVYKITTDPGSYYLKNPMRVAGTAIMVPGQYRSAYTIGSHKTYEALVQRGKNPIKVYRDSNLDEILDMHADSVMEGWYGVNIHKAGSDSTIVHRWSAGCQVFKTSSDFNDFMTLVNRAAKYWGPTFTYTLLEEKDFEDCQ